MKYFIVDRENKFAGVVQNTSYLIVTLAFLASKYCQNKDYNESKVFICDYHFALCLSCRLSSFCCCFLKMLFNGHHITGIICWFDLYMFLVMNSRLVHVKDA